VTRRHRDTGLTVLELMIVIAIIGALAAVLRTGFNALTKAELVEDATEFATLLKRTSSLAIENGEMHRLVIDMDKQVYVVEVCQGQTALVRNEQLRNDDEKTKQAIEKGKQRLAQLPSDALAVGDPDEATRRATAISGHHIADRQCVPVQDGVSGDTHGKEFLRALRSNKGIKFKKVWVAHQDEPQTKGQVAFYFFPTGAAEKAIVEITDGDSVLTTRVYGITGRVQLSDGALPDPNEHMLKNVLGDKDAEREDGR
jgi:prepilin-type N-terminal cleavage/methylation domain-containing protein